MKYLGKVNHNKKITTKEYIDDKVKTDVPINAVFTDTKYSEISQSEILSGASRSSRSISARRLKYAIENINHTHNISDIFGLYSSMREGDIYTLSIGSTTALSIGVTIEIVPVSVNISSKSVTTHAYTPRPKQIGRSILYGGATLLLGDGMLSGGGHKRDEFSSIVVSYEESNNRLVLYNGGDSKVSGFETYAIVVLLHGS